MALNIGDALADGSIIVQDKDRLCYQVLSTSKGASGIRTISKALLDEWIAAVNANPQKTSQEIRTDLCGKSSTDKFEYGYNATLQKLAEMSLGKVPVTHQQILVQNVLVSNTSAPSKNHQRIIYGAPGTGKSHKISAVANEKNSIRVTFHPDTDYSAFMGAYKPTMVDVRRTYVNEGVEKDVVDDEGKPVVEKKIVYSFVPQAFMKAYVEAWRRWCDGDMSDDDKVFYLVIEEINRGNCAQIFGDAFQLLDRCSSGFSSYAISPDDDIERFLSEDKDWNLSGLALTEDVTNDEGKVVATVDQIKHGERMALPPNLRIWATMNTSDQSLFPMDSAFKRRWDWEYMPIKDENKGYKIKVGTGEYEWWSFLKKINDEIAEYTSSEDKQLGYFFARPKDGGDVIDTQDFVSKVIFYLWKDVFKDDLPQINPFKYTFKDGEDEREREIRFTDFYQADLKDKLVTHFLDKLGVQKVQAQTGQTATTEGATMQTQDTDGAAAPAAAATDGAPGEDAEG